MDVENSLWERLVQKVEPATAGDEAIEEILIELKNGGVTARTLSPTPMAVSDSSDYDVNTEDTSDELDLPTGDVLEDIADLEDITQHESVFLYGGFGVKLKSKILQKIDQAVVDQGRLSSIELVRVIVREDEFSMSVEITNSVLNSNIKEQLATALAADGEIDDPSELAFGVIDKVYESDGRLVESGWEFDGTLYRYTNTPYESWYRQDGDLDDMEDWKDFAAENELQRNVIDNRDTHVVHFHPMRRGLDETHPLIEWFHDVEETAQSLNEFDHSVVKDISVDKVVVDDGRVKVHTRIVL